MNMVDINPAAHEVRLSQKARVPPPNRFDVNDLRPANSWTARLLPYAPQILGALRLVKPIPRWPGWAGVTRFDDVREVLTEDAVFQVPFGEKVRALNGGPNFLLGMQDDADYQRYRSQVMQAFSRDDVATLVAPMSRAFSDKIITACGGRLDAVQDLITRVPVLVCENYYGVRIPEEKRVAFAQWTIAMSDYMFGDPGDDSKLRRGATAAAEQVRFIVRDAIDTARETSGYGENTVLRRLLTMQSDGAEGLTDLVISAFLIGMIVGFVPTNTMAAGHMLEMLLKRPDFLAPTQAAAQSGDDDLLKRCLFEAMRFMPLNPGPFRRCEKDYIIAKGTRRASLIKAGTKMLPSTQSAMFDPRRVRDPKRFDPTRPSLNYMLFGYGRHWCIGAHIAEAQITQMFKSLLLRQNLHRADGPAGQLQRLGPFPAHLVVEFGR